ncbi:MAG: cyclic nucleotide-binding domain-containing protein [Planctomycetes bacterium]|nr:cyclic nucleotide-binding domain-containing protein [Planctomycetota bacterium]
MVRIVILGGGFAGTAAAVEVARQLAREPGVQLHLVSDENYSVFQPMLPEVVAGGIEPTHIVQPLRQLAAGVRFHCARVHAIDWERRMLTLAESDSPRHHQLGWDQLVIALGQVIDLSRIPGMAQHAMPIKTLGDAFHLRNHVLSRLEQAELESDETRRRWLLTFVTIGGGFSGIETAAEVHDLVRRALPSYPRAEATGHRMVVVHSRDVILNELDPSLGAFAQQTMVGRGVEFRLGRRSQEATPDGVRLDDSTFLSAGTVICTIGNAPHPLLTGSPLPQQGGRIVTDACLRVVGRADVWALGDAAAVPDVRRGGNCPPTAQYAVRQGKQIGRNLIAALRGEPLQPFSFGGLGQLAVVGHHCGVAQICGIKLSGFVAWVLWRSVYWAKLPSFVCKVRVGLDWLLDLVFPRDLTKFETRRSEALSESHWRAGDCLVREGERGDTFFVIQKGRVEIVRADLSAPGGERRLAEKGPGESFGETALLTDSPRNATVRALTAVDVLTFKRADFQKLVASYGVLRQQMERDLARNASASPGADAPARDAGTV